MLTASATNQGGGYVVKMAMSQTDEGQRRYEYKVYNQSMVFTDDRCGNLVVETMQGY